MERFEAQQAAIPPIEDRIERCLAELKLAATHTAEQLRALIEPKPPDEIWIVLWKVVNPETTAASNL